MLAGIMSIMVGRIVDGSTACTGTTGIAVGIGGLGLACRFSPRAAARRRRCIHLS